MIFSVHANLIATSCNTKQWKKISNYGGQALHPLSPRAGCFLHRQPQADPKSPESAHRFDPSLSGYNNPPLTLLAIAISHPEHPSILQPLSRKKSGLI